MSTTGAPAAAKSISDAPVFDTVPKLLLRNAERYGELPALRHKDYGIWQTWTWARLRDEVRLLAIGLRKLGIERGDAVAIIGDNRPRLYATFAAVQSEATRLRVEISATEIVGLLPRAALDRSAAYFPLLENFHETVVIENLLESRGANGT